MEQQSKYAVTAAKIETCTVCERKFSHRSYLDHLFLNKDCMRKYWEDEGKNHISRMRQGRVRVQVALGHADVKFVSAPHPAARRPEQFKS